MRRILVLTMILAVALLGACGSDDDGGDTTSGASDTTAAPSATDAPAAGATTLKTVDSKFEPTTLTAKAGEAMTIKIENAGQAEHNFSIKELDVDQDIEPGKTETVSFTPKDAGTLTFFCEYHEGSGMKGTLTVS